MTETRSKETGRRSAKNRSRFSRRQPTETAQEKSTAQETAQETSTAQETARTNSETIRTHRTLPRTTLQPSVQDFSGKIIERGFGESDEDYMLWAVGGGKGQLKLNGTRDDHTYPVSTTFKWVSSFSPAYLESVRLPLVPNALKAERVAAWTEDVHRRHVARTARVRARLAPKPMAAERVVPTSAHSAHADRTSFSLTAENDIVDDPRMVQTSRVSSNQERANRTRPRPATTGRYFDRGNGLRCTKPMVADCSRPCTAADYRACIAPGLNITKVVLRRKEIVE